MVVKDVYRPSKDMNGTLTIHNSFSTVKNVNLYMVFKNNDGSSQITFYPFPMNFDIGANSVHYITYIITSSVISNITAGTYYLTFTVEDSNGNILLDYNVSDPQFRIVY